MLVYHGSPNKFNKFDYSKIRTNGTSEGVGFYFTDNKNIAAGYATNGYLYTVKFKGNKALSDNEKTISREEVKQIIIELHKQTDFLSNYGEVEYEGYENVLNVAIENVYDYCDSDSEILTVLYNTVGENEIVIKLFYELLGYDHIFSIPNWGNQKLYIALTNEIIEIVNVEKLD